MSRVPPNRFTLLPIQHVLLFHPGLPLPLCLPSSVVLLLVLGGLKFGNVKGNCGGSGGVRLGQVAEEPSGFCGIVSSSGVDVNFIEWLV